MDSTATGSQERTTTALDMHARGHLSGVGITSIALSRALSEYLTKIAC